MNMSSFGFWNPEQEIADMRRLVRNVFGRGVLDEEAITRPLRAIAALAPSLDLEEVENGYLVSCELPGVREDDIDVNLRGNVLTIRAEKRRERGTRLLGKAEEKKALPGGKESGQEGAREGERASGKAHAKSEEKPRSGEAVATRDAGAMTAESARPVFSERSYGMFERVLTLPEDVDAEKIDATLRQGVLQVFLPRSESRKPRQIPVKH